MGHTTYVFCHGLNGWGELDEQNERHSYWSCASGDTPARWRSLGLDACAASVAPQGSAWDHACELYAQIVGERTDYGVAHAAEYGHPRFGRNFAGKALVPGWGEGSCLVLVGHSFGGATIRLLGELLAHGSEEERAATRASDLSPLFRGGMGERVRVIVTLAAPTNGTTAYDMVNDPAFDSKYAGVSPWHWVLDRIVKSNTAIRMDGRDPRDWASFDMRLDNARALNERIAMLPHVYYLSVACDATKPGANGERVPDLAVLDPLFVRTSKLMGRYSGHTAAGCVVDDAWHANDGLVNTLSARAPIGAPQRPLGAEGLEKGVWNVLPDLHADHGYFQGGYTLHQDPSPFFDILLDLLTALE